MRYEYFIGLRYLRATRRQTFVSVITVISISGVTLGVAALIIVLSGMLGVQEYMRDKILGFNAHLLVRPMWRPGIVEPAEVIQKIKTVPGVTGASLFIEEEAMLKGPRANVGVLMRGIDPATVNEVMTIEEHLVSGTLAALDPQEGGDLPTIAIGYELADRLGAYQGSELSVILPEGGISPLGIRPIIKRFRVVAVYRFDFWMIDSQSALIHLDTARQIFSRGEFADMIEVKTDNIYKVGETRKKMESALGERYRVDTWFDTQKELFAALKVEQLLSTLALSLIMVVASFNIISILLMLVMEKYRDIAILKSMGATDGGIMKIFITQGVVIGLLGTLTGVGLGLLGCWLQIRYQLLSFDPTVYQFSAVPMKITWQNVAAVSLGAMLLSFLTTLYPSWQAARSKPAESLRYE